MTDLKLLQSSIVLWILNFVDQPTHDIHENWYPTNKSDFTVYVFWYFWQIDFIFELEMSSESKHATSCHYYWRYHVHFTGFKFTLALDQSRHYWNTMYLQFYSDFASIWNKRGILAKLSEVWKYMTTVKETTTRQLAKREKKIVHQLDEVVS